MGSGRLLQRLEVAERVERRCTTGSGATPARSQASRIWRASSRWAGSSAVGAADVDGREVGKLAEHVEERGDRAERGLPRALGGDRDGHVGDARGSPRRTSSIVRSKAGRAVVSPGMDVHDAGAGVDRALGLLGQLVGRERHRLRAPCGRAVPFSAATISIGSLTARLTRVEIGELAGRSRPARRARGPARAGRRARSARSASGISSASAMASACPRTSKGLTLSASGAELVVRAGVLGQDQRRRRVRSPAGLPSRSGSSRRRGR